MTINKYIGRVHNDVTTENVRKFLDSHKVNVIESEQLETKHNRFKSFRLRVRRDDLEKLKNKTFGQRGFSVDPTSDQKEMKKDLTPTVEPPLPVP